MDKYNFASCLNQRLDSVTKRCRGNQSHFITAFHSPRQFLFFLFHLALVELESFHSKPVSTLRAKAHTQSPGLQLRACCKNITLCAAHKENSTPTPAPPYPSPRWPERLHPGVLRLRPPTQSSCSSTDSPQSPRLLSKCSCWTCTAEKTTDEEVTVSQKRTPYASRCFEAIEGKF